MQNMTWNEMATAVHTNAVDKGWWESGDRELEEILMLTVTEVSEATEAVRSEWPDVCFTVSDTSVEETIRAKTKKDGKTTGMVSWEVLKELNHSVEGRKPEGEATELADAVIRGLDFAGRSDLDIDNLIDGLRSEVEIDPDAGVTALKVHYDLTAILTAETLDAEAKVCCLIVATEAYFKLRGWDLKAVIELKHNYNKTRPYRHGGKVA